MRALRAVMTILILEIRLQVHKRFDGREEETMAYEKIKY